MNPSTRSQRSAEPNGPELGFTLVELLVVTAVVAFGAMLLMPALARTQPDTRAARCLNNHRQLTRAWLMYADDNNDRLATSLQGGGAQTSTQPMWARGWLDQSTSPDNTNTVFLTDPRYSILALYCGKNARLFKCPADDYLSPTQRARGWKERVRSISQNLYVANSNVEAGAVDSNYLHVTKLAGLLNPKPADTWVSIDENPYSINDAGFFAPHATDWIDFPANYHDGGAGVAFADGHSEIHRWQASVVNPPVTANDLDIQWLRYRTPRKPGVN